MFRQILENSRQLTAHIVPPAPAPFERGLDQIEAQSRRLLRAHTGDAGVGGSDNNVVVGTGAAQTQRLAGDLTAAVAAAAPSGARGLAADGSLFQNVSASPAIGVSHVSSNTKGAAPMTADTATQPQSLDPRTAYLLARHGFDAERVSHSLRQIDLSNTFEPLQGVPDADVDAFLRNEHENIVSIAINGAKSQVSNDFDAGFECRIARDWSAVKKRIFEDIGHQIARPARGGSTADMMDSSTTTSGGIGFQGPGLGGLAAAPFSGQSSSASGLASNPHYHEFLLVVRSLNDARLRKTPINLAAAFARASERLTGNSQHEFIARLWRMFSLMLSGGRSSGLEGAQQGQFRAICRLADEPMNSTQATAFRSGIVAGGRRWLEESYRLWASGHVRSELAEIGGMPTADTEVDALLRLRFMRNGLWSLPWLDLSIGNTPFWAHVFILVRMGLREDAFAYIQRHQAELSRTDDRNFPVYFKAWINAPDGRLPKMHRDKLLSEWNSSIRNYYTAPRMSPAGDLFKYTLYKLIGRCDMNNKAIRNSDVSTTVDDYLWIHLMLVQEETLPTDAAHERFTLRDFSILMQRYGLNHFKSRSTWFMVLLLCGEFERAVAELLDDPVHGPDALHFAITFAYYGVLRVPENPKSLPTCGGYLSVRPISIPATGAPYEMAYFHFARMVLLFARGWAWSDPLDVLHYVYLLPLCGPVDVSTGVGAGDTTDVSAAVAQGRDYDHLAQRTIVELVLANSNRFSELLGQLRADGSGRTPGHVETYRMLLHMDTDQEYMQAIVLSAASEAESESRVQDAVELYHLAGLYDKVMRLLIAVVGEQLMQKAAFLASNSAGSRVGGASGIGVGVGYAMDAASLASGSVTGANGPAGRRTSTLGSTDASLPLLAIDVDPVEATEQLLRFYQSRTRTSTTLTRKTVSTATLLIQLSRFCVQIETGRDESALATVYSLNVFPVSNDIVLTQGYVESFSDLDESVARVMPYVMLMVVQGLSRVYSAWSCARSSGYVSTPARSGEYRGESGVAAAGPGDGRLADVRQRARVLVQFAGMVKYRIPGDVFAKMNKIEVMM